MKEVAVSLPLMRYLATCRGASCDLCAMYSPRYKRVMLTFMSTPSAVGGRCTAYPVLTRE